MTATPPSHEPDPQQPQASAQPASLIQRTLAAKADGPWRLLVLASLFVVSDQVTKWLVASYIPPNTYHFESANPPIPVIEGFFYLVHIFNRGAAWGILEGMGFWLGLLGIVALGGIVWFRRELGLERKCMQYAFGMMIGGIIGNMIDRFRFHHVVDFLDFHLIGGYRYPSFNIADCGIVVGVALYILFSFLEPEKPAEAKPSR